MNRYLKIFLAALLLLLLPASLLATGWLLPSFYQEAYYAELAQMYDRLYETEGKKIVIVGGSNVAFGVNGELLENTLREQGLDYTVCPFGLYAAVGTSAMLDLSADALGEGDIVVLAIEPGDETMSTYFGATAFWKCTEEKSEMLLKLGQSKLSAMVGNYVPYLQERVAIQVGGSAPVAEGVYAKSSFNDRCDMIYDRPGNIMSVGYDTGAVMDLDELTIEEAFREQVNEYCEAAREKGASVVMSFSPMNRSAIRDNSETAVAAFFQICNEAFNCPIISDPHDYILESGWFYDTNFHLNNAGCTLRTYRLAEDLLSYLGCYAALDYETPQMPGSTVEAPVEETDTTDFLFSPVTDADGATVGYQISGLTQQGLSKDTLVVPAGYEGKSVVGFTADALAGAAKLVELRLPDSIESLPDGLFRDCTAMTRLILEHTSGLCAVTAHTFDGADQIRVHVPSEAYALYRDGEGCETNPWYQYLDRIVTY